VGGDGEGVYVKVLGEDGAEVLGEVAHVGELGFGAVVEVVGELLGAKFRIGTPKQGFGQLRAIHSD
jgi:hypothetical protein